MISEAVNSNKHTIILKLKRKKQNFVSKHEKFAEGLEKEGYANICENNLFDRISEIWRRRPAIKELADQKNIVRKLEEIL